MLFRFLILAISIVMSACSEVRINTEKYARLHYDLKCIWDKAPHCAFTSLVEYEGKLYCSFREANAHMPNLDDGGYGIVRILESSNGDDWYSVCVIEDAKHDLRDPHMCVTPDNKLMVSCGRTIVNSNGMLESQPCVVYFFDSVQSIYDANYETYDVNIDNDDNYSSYWLWKVKWCNDLVYGVAYYENLCPVLVKSTDGINYNIITMLNVSANEIDIEFVNNNMVVIGRAIDQAHNGYIGYSEYPYVEWEWNDLNHFIQSPELILIDDSLMLSGRGANGTTLYHVLEDRVTPIITLPSNGDSGYPGMLYDKYSDKLLVSYYTTPSTTQIHLAKFLISDIL